MAAVRPCSASQPKTPASTISFQITPCPPGFMTGASGPPSSQRPSSAPTTGTSGCWKSRNDCRPRPYQADDSNSSSTRQWLPLAADVMTAMGVVACTPCSFQ